MLFWNKGRFTAAIALTCLSAVQAHGQYTKITTPFHTVNDSFYERMGVGFGFDIRAARNLPGDDRGRSAVVGLDPTGAPTPDGSIQFRHGGVALPPFGGYNAANDATLGFANRGREGSLYFNFDFGQGSRRSHVMQAPSIVLPNGGQGTFSDTTQRPFVTGLIPVVGSFGGGGSVFGPVAPQRVSPLFDRIQRLHAQAQAAQAAQNRPARREHSQQERVALGENAGGHSSAEHGDLSVAEIRRRQSVEAEAKDADLQAWIERARGAEEAGKHSVAKIYYRIAAKQASGQLKQELLEKVKQLDSNQP